MFSVLNCSWMKNWSPSLSAVLLITIISNVIALSVVANGTPVAKWTVKKPFEQKVFIENKGQYSIEKEKVNSTDILFGARQDGLHYYFTKNSIWIKYTHKVKRSKKEMEDELKRLGINEKESEEEEKEFAFKLQDEFFQMEFVGAGAETKVLAENSVQQKYNFAITALSTVSASAYKKIIYKNLYPGIDMEVFFPGDKQGFKYNLIVNSGASVSAIKIKYPFEKKIGLTSVGDLTIKSVFGNFTDHAPVANLLSTNQPVKCSFSLKDETVQFNVENYNSSNGLVIDPWLVPPTFTGGGDAYDVDWDKAGNCYAYGGAPPYQLIKFDPTGAILWSFTTSFSSTLFYYGDFAVDKISESCYIVDGFNANGAEVLKLNSSGFQVASYPGNGNFREMWRIAFNPCTNQAVIAGGGTTSPSYTGCYLDTNLTNLNLVNILNINNPAHDMWGLALDNFGSCYMSTSYTSGDNQFDNVLLKLPLPNLSPTTWMANTNYLFQEVVSNQYVLPVGANGFNGLCVSNQNVYTYDSYILEQWNALTGIMTGSANVGGVSQNTMTYGGLTADDCDHVFVGLNNTIKQYNGTVLAGLVATMPGTVYDLSLDKNNILYSCGVGFVSAMQLSLPACSILATNNQITNATCNHSDGSATITVSGGTAPYIITWNTTPVQNGPTASNLAPGTYIATIKDSSCTQITKYDTVIISATTNIPTLSVTSDTICSGQSTVLTATGATSYSWNNGAIPNGANTAIVSPITSTSYTVTATSNGCTDSVVATVLVHDKPIPTINASNATTFCLGDTVILQANVGYSSYVWSNGATAPAISVFSSGVFFVTVTDTNGCIGTSDTTINVTVIPPDNATFQYTSGTYCNSGIDPAPAITGLAGGSFTSSPAGLSINSSTGIIDLSSSIIGAYNVTYTTAGLCPNSSAITITISDTSVAASFSFASSSFCQNASNPFPVFASGASAGVFSATPAGLVFVNVNTGEIDLSASTPGAYTITNTIAPSGNCNTATATASIVIIPADNSMFHYSSATYCNSGINPTPTITGLTGGTFSATPTGLVITASTGVIDLATSTLGAYTLSYVTAGPCPDTTSILMTITDTTPTANFAYIDSVFCQNEGNYTPYYIGGSSAGYYTAIPSGLVFVHVNTGEIDLGASAPGTYVITNAISVSGSCSAASSSTTIVINASPVVTPSSGLLMVCDSTTISINLSSTTPGTSFHWIVNEIGVSGASASNGNTISQTLTLTGTSQGTATYIITPTAATCMGDSLVIPVFVNPLPHANTSSVVTTSASCTSATGSITGITIASGQGPFHYQWLDSTGAVVDTSINLSNAHSGTYTLVITDLNGCSSIAGSFAVSSSSSSSPTVDTTAIVMAPANCGDSTGSIIGLTIVSGQAPFQYQWKDSTGTIVSTSLTLTNMPSGNYTLTVTDSNGCNVVNSGYHITDSGTLVNAAYTCNPITGENPLTVNFTNSSTGASTYLWHFGTGDSSTVTNPEYTYLPFGNFTICLIASNNSGCRDTACSQIDVAVNSVFIVPNVFTPNNDNVNDIFWVIGDGFKTMDVEIYNRWGQRLYEWHTINGGWDGRTTSGVPAADGTYYYIVNATKVNGKEFKKNGYFSLLRN